MSPAPDLRVALVGYGRMGRTLDRLAPEAGIEVVARLDRDDALSTEALAGAQVAIEFTLPDVAPGVIGRLAECGVDVVSGTTGWGEQLPTVTERVQATGRGLVHASNFSIGVALFRRMVREAARLAGADGAYDLHLAETHHTGKVDHPSGTAVTLAETVLEATPSKLRWAEDPPSGTADPEVLGVAVSRVGSVPGTHVLSIDGPDDRIELRHEARSRDGFARGALSAARWIRGRTGVYTLDDLLEERLG